MKEKGTLYLIPTIIAEGTAQHVISHHVRDVLKPIQFFLVEDIRTARRYLSSLSIYSSIEQLYFNTLDKNTTETDLPQLMSPLDEGKPVGIISESGCPGVADPGALAVNYAHRKDIKVVPLVGPSSILLALMASGLNGQRFAFNGYLPVEAQEAGLAIKKFENESKAKNETQIFIETPYRNNALTNHLLKNLSDHTLLCIAVNVTGYSEMIKTQTVKEWRSQGITLPKEPALFLFLSV